MSGIPGCKCRECKPKLDGLRADIPIPGFDAQPPKTFDRPSEGYAVYAPPQETKAVNETILEEAQRIVHSDRGANYGHPIDDYTRTGRIWGAILGLPDIDPRICCLMMVAVKISRETNKHKRDNLTDLAGYAECASMVAERQGL